jgi:hypothetical protein
MVSEDCRQKSKVFRQTRSNEGEQEQAVQRAEQEIGFLALWSLWAMTIAIPYNTNLVRDVAKRVLGELAA